MVVSCRIVKLMGVGLLVEFESATNAVECATAIQQGMALRNAARRCKDARILAPHPDRYEQAMRALLKQALPYSPFIETGEDDGHLFMDATGTTRLFGSPMDVAWRLRKQIRTDLCLDPIWSVAPNKLVAKVATRLVKPDGEYIVAAGEEKSLLAPLPIHLVPGIEPRPLVTGTDERYSRPVGMPGEVTFIEVARRQTARVGITLRIHQVDVAAAIMNPATGVGTVRQPG